MSTKSNTMHEISQYINNMTKKKIDLCFVHEETSDGKRTDTSSVIKFIKKITLYLMNALYTAPYHAHTIKLIIHWIDTL